MSPDSFIPPQPLNTAVLFLVFNRLDTTQQVFEAIREAKPPRLYIAADGARETKAGEAEKVTAVRDFLLQNIDWECEIKTLFREENLGCKYAVSSAIDWFFENEEMGIILEDDCLPSQGFFGFCEEMLLRYKDDMRIWHIGGASTLNKKMLLNNESYYFSKFNHIWGWASWSSRWKEYDVNVPLFKDFSKNNYIENISGNMLKKSFWLNNFESVFENKIDTWDYQWYFTVWVNSGLSIIPTVNMISNIGFGVDATHTSDAGNKLSNMTKENMSSNLIHPKLVMPNILYDNYNSNFLFSLTYFGFFKRKIITKIKEIIRKSSL